MISDPADVKRFLKQVRRCSFCGKVIDRPEEGERIVTRNLSRAKWDIYLHTGCVYAAQKIREVYHG